MKTESIRYFSGTQGLHSRLQTIDCGDADRILELRAAFAPSVFVIKSEDLPALRVVKQVVVDRGTKHGKVSLSRYLLGHQQIPVLESGFGGPAQICRSIRALLKQAHLKDDANIYLLGVACEIFELLRNRASDGDEAKPEEYIHAQEHPAARQDTEPRALLEKLFLGKSDQARKIRSFIRCAADSDDEVLILGETGTGKEVIARAIHLLRHGNLENMQVINCAAISESLLEAELFGYRKGAFTGADRDRKGLWEISQNGTLFLDEIGDLSPNHQAKILRALAEKKIRPVGSSRQIAVNARIIAATNVDLVSRVKSGEFRDDLYYRLNTFPIFVPPLRDRHEDIAVLASKFWNDINGKQIPPLDEEIIEALTKRDWPGNVRVLHSFLRCLRTLNHEKLAQGTSIGVKDVHFAFAYHGQQNFPFQPGIASDEVRLHPAHCLRRLKRVSDIFYSIRIAVIALLDDRPGQYVHRESILNNIRELEMLCDPDDKDSKSLFHSVPTLNAVCGFADEITKITDDHFASPREHSPFWLKLSEELSRVMDVVFTEIERITS